MVNYVFRALQNSEDLVSVNHAHTEKSNNFTGLYGEQEFFNHQMEPLKIRDALPGDFVLGYEMTEHYSTNPEGISDLRWDIRERGGEIEEGERFLVGAYEHEGEDKVIWINHGAEFGTEWGENSHICSLFRPLYDQTVHSKAPTHDVYNFSKDALLNRVAHPAAPGNETPEHRVREYIEKADEDGFKVDLGFTTGYGLLLDNVARGDRKINWLTGSRFVDDSTSYSKDVADLAEEYQKNGFDVRTGPELDAHIYLPMDGFGLGHIEDGSDVVSQMIADEEVTEETVDTYRDQNVVGVNKWRTRLKDSQNFHKSFPDIAGIYDIDQEMWDEVKKETLDSYRNLEVENIRNRVKPLP